MLKYIDNLLVHFYRQLLINKLTNTVNKSNFRLNNNNVPKKSWDINRLNELSKPRIDYYEYT